MNVVKECPGQPSTIKNFPAQNINSVKFEESCRRISERYKTGDSKDLKVVGSHFSYKEETPEHRATAKVHIPANME